MSQKPANAHRKPVTLALHFLQPTRPRDIQEPAVVATFLVERVLRVLRTLLPEIGPVIVRCAPLLTEWGSDDGAMDWWDSMRPVRSFENGSLSLFGADSRPNLRRVWVVSLTGRLKGLLSTLGEPLKHHIKQRLLFIAEIDPENRLHELLYLSPAMTPIGEMHSDGRFEAAFDLIEYAPEMTDMLDRLLGETSFSMTAVRQLQKLVAPLK